MIALIPTDNPSADSPDCFIATATALTLAAVAASAGTSVAAAKMSANAQNNAAKAQTASNDKALDFTKQQAAEDQARFEQTQHANYNQHADKYAAARSLGAEYGLNLPEARPYVSTAYAGQPGAPGQPQGQPNAQDPAAFIANYQKTHSPTEGPTGILNAMKQAGFNVAPYMYGQTPSGNEITLNGGKYKVISGENGPNPGWYTAGTNDSAPRSPIGSSYLSAMTPQMQPPAQDFRLRSINAFL